MLPMLTRRISEALEPFQIFYGAIPLLSAASVPNADASEVGEFPLGSTFLIHPLSHPITLLDDQILQNRIPSSTSDLIIGSHVEYPFDLLMPSLQLRYQSATGFHRLWIDTQLVKVARTRSAAADPEAFGLGHLEDISGLANGGDATSFILGGRVHDERRVVSARSARVNRITLSVGRVACVRRVQFAVADGSPERVH